MVKKKISFKVFFNLITNIDSIKSSKSCGSQMAFKPLL